MGLRVLVLHQLVLHAVLYDVQNGHGVLHQLVYAVVAFKNGKRATEETVKSANAQQ